MIDKNTSDEINTFNAHQLWTLFFQVHGWIAKEHEYDINIAIESAMADARKFK